MLVENSVVVADFIRGIFIPMQIISIVCFILFWFVIIYSSCELKPKALWWLIPLGAELLFALWFFATFTIK